MQDDRLPRLTDQPAIDVGVIVRPGPDGGKRPRCHQDRLTACRLDGLQLDRIGRNDVVGCLEIFQRHLIGACPAGNTRLQRMRLRLFHGAFDQFLCRCPVNAHAALRGVHGLGQSQPLLPQPVPEFQRIFPIDSRRTNPWIALAQRIRHHMRRGKRGAG